MNNSDIFGSRGTLANTGKGARGSVGNIIGQIFGLNRSDLEFATKTLAQVEANWLDKFQATVSARAFPIRFHEYENAPATSQKETTKSGYIFESDKKSGENKNYVIGVGAEETSRLSSFNNRELYAYNVYDSGIIEGISIDGTKMQPFKVCVITNYLDNEGGGKAQRMEFSISYLEIAYMQNNKFHLNTLQSTDINVHTLIDSGVKDVTLTVVDNTVEVVDFAGNPVTGLLAANFLALKVSDSSVITLTSTPDSVYPNIYTLTGYAGAATLTLKPPATTGLGYEYQGTAVAITLEA